MKQTVSEFRAHLVHVLDTSREQLATLGNALAGTHPAYALENRGLPAVQHAANVEAASEMIDTLDAVLARDDDPQTVADHYHREAQRWVWNMPTRQSTNPFTPLLDGARATAYRDLATDTILDQPITITVEPSDS